MIQEILGTDTWQSFATQFFFAITGMLVSLLLHGANRQVEEPTTPNNFSIKFLVADNWKRIVLNILLVYITIRFFQELTGMQLSLFFCLIIGLGYDKLAQWIKSKSSILEVNRDKIQ